MPERDLALAVLFDAIKCNHRAFLLADGDYEEIALFWYQVAGLEPIGERRLDRVLNEYRRTFYQRVHGKLTRKESEAGDD